MPAPTTFITIQTAPAAAPASAVNTTSPLNDRRPSVMGLSGSISPSRDRTMSLYAIHAVNGNDMPFSL
ncbi:hypothetical protein HDU98_005719 [Podochytrium sp. JEL0797]|nr:hypothetical protein HDU98_005719 [Podochytrium sp. JEL0797]